MPAGVLADPLETRGRPSRSSPRPGDREPGRRRPRRPGRAPRRRSPRAGPTWRAGPTPRPTSPAAARVDPLAVPPGRRGLSRPPRRPQRRDVRPATVRAVPQLPQIAKRFGFRFALHLRLRRRPVPDPTRGEAALGEPRRDSLESLLRPPLAADRPSQGWLLPWRLAATMKDDHVAAVPLVHWPSPVASWYRRPAPGRRLLAGPGALGHAQRLLPPDRPALRDVPPRAGRLRNALPGPGRRRGEPEPISRLARHHRLRRSPGDGPDDPGSGTGRRRGRRRPSAVRDIAGDIPRSRDRRSRSRHSGRTKRPQHWTRRAAPGRRLLTRHHRRRRRGQRRPKRRGYLVLNPLGVPRRAAVLLPEAALDLRPEGPLRAAQFTEEGVWAVVDLPAFGFAWVPAETDPARPPAAAERPVGQRPRAPQRVDRGRDRRDDRRPPGHRGGRRGDGAARPATRRSTGLVDAAGQAGQLADAVATGSRSITAAPPWCRRPPPAS